MLFFDHPLFGFCLAVVIGPGRVVVYTEDGFVLLYEEYIVELVLMD